MKHHVEIRSEGERTQVLIDGHDVAWCVTGLAYTVSLDQSPQLCLDMRLLDQKDIDSPETSVVLGDGVADALRVLGWTPPKDSEG